MKFHLNPVAVAVSASFLITSPAWASCTNGESYLDGAVIALTGGTARGPSGAQSGSVANGDSAPRIDSKKVSVLGGDITGCAGAVSPDNNGGFGGGSAVGGMSIGGAGGSASLDTLDNNARVIANGGVGGDVSSNIVELQGVEITGAEGGQANKGNGGAAGGSVFGGVSSGGVGGGTNLTFDADQEVGSLYGGANGGVGGAVTDNKVTLDRVTILGVDAKGGDGLYGGYGGGSVFGGFSVGGVGGDVSVALNNASSALNPEILAEASGGESGVVSRNLVVLRNTNITGGSGGTGLGGGGGRWGNLNAGGVGGGIIAGGLSVGGGGTNAVINSSGSGSSTLKAGAIAKGGNGGGCNG